MQLRQTNERHQVSLVGLQHPAQAPPLTLVIAQQALRLREVDQKRRCLWVSGAGARKQLAARAASPIRRAFIPRLFSATG